MEKNGTFVTTKRKEKVLVVFPSLGEKIERHGRQRVREVSLPVVIDL